MSKKVEGKPINKAGTTTHTVEYPATASSSDNLAVFHYPTTPPKRTGDQLIDDYRVYPRVLMALAYAFTGYAWYVGMNWFFSFDPKGMADTVAIAMVAVPGSMLAALTATVGKLTDNYFRT